MKNNLIASGKIFVGKVNRNGDTNKAHGPRNCAVYVTFELKEGENGPEFSSCAEAWNNRRTDVFIAGQCHETFAKMMHGDARRILEIWREWHLNDMQAGTPEQMACLEAAKTAGTEAVLMRCNHYDWALHVLKSADLYEVPLPVGQKCTGNFPPEVLNGSRGYRYGERWLYRSLPVAVVEEVKAIAIRCSAKKEAA